MKSTNLTKLPLLTVLCLLAFGGTGWAQTQCDAEAEFSYDQGTYCQNGAAPIVNHATGTNGVYSYIALTGGPNLALNTATGDIDVSSSDAGTYQVTNTVTVGGSASLVITGVIDGPLTGGVPKAVEFYALEDIPDLSIYGFGSANNGGGTDGEEYTFPADAVTAGTYIWVATETPNFNAFFGFDPTYTDGNAPNINGDDAIELFCNGQVIDVFGDINVDGTGQPWDHVDGWAYRVSDTGPDGSTFVLNNWTFSGTDALDNETTNATAAIPFPIGSYGNVCATASLIITGVIDGPLTGGVPKAVEFYAVNDIADLSIYGFGSANNGGGTDGEEYTFPADAVTAGTYIWVATETPNFNAFFGFDPTYTDGNAPNINGDDAIELFCNGQVIDVFGDINVDGTGEPWDHLDGWAYRVSNTGPDGTTFVLGNWTFSGTNALDNETTNATAAIPFPIGTFSFACPGDMSFVCIQTIVINAPPFVDAGGDQIVCGGGPVNLAAVSDVDGSWSGGLGTFGDANSASTTYTADPSEIGTTVVLTYTTIDPDGVDGPCSGAVGTVQITFVPEADAEFSYDADEYCPNGVDPVLSHTSGSDGIYTYAVVSGGPTLALDPETGAIDLSGSDQGTYDVTNTVSGCGNLVISGVIDGPVTGGLPKAVEFYAVVDIPDLSAYGFGSANNGGGSDGIEFQFPAVSVAQGTHIWVATESAVFEDFFGFPPTYVANLAASINGDDAIELFCNGQVIDVFGDINMSGTGQPWEYMDGWAYRNNSTGPDGASFQLGNWFFSGPNALDNAATNATAQVPFPIGSFFSTVPGICPDDQFTVTITIQDIEAPVIVCPADIVINLDPGLCDQIVLFGVTATDNCDPNPAITQTDGGGLSSGDAFPIGSYTLTFTATDLFNNSSSCSFDVEVLEFANPTSTLACNDLVQVSLDQTGCAIIGADMILEGGPYGCYDDYIVDVVDLPGSPNNQVCCAQIGGPWTVMVTDPDTGNKCWGEIVVEDKTAPVFLCPADPIQIGCAADPNLVAPPIAIDNCTLVDVQLVSETFVDQNTCDDGVALIVRTWIAYDTYGNESDLCVQEIEIVRPDDIDFPNDIIWECDQYADYPNITAAAALHPSIAALQVGTDVIDATAMMNPAVLGNTGSGLPDAAEGVYCNYGYTYADEVVATCGNTFKIIRTWTVLDWCNGQVILGNDAGEDNIQIIKVVDATPPAISMAPYNVNANIPGEHPQPCKSQDFLPPANITDNCSNWTVQIFTPVGEAVYLNGQNGNDGGFIPAPGLGLGVHQITYQATDECGNVAELEVTINVVDMVAPTTICDEITEVALTSDGMAVVPADVFDDGSYDNCCLDEFLARRMDGDCEGNFDDFGPTVEFCCVDVPNNPIMVVFRAVDCFGNYNDCMVQVLVQDKTPPVVSCPPPASIDCDDYLDNYAAAVANGNYGVLDVFGVAVYFDNCATNVDYNVTVNINTCQEGTITRTWTVTDNQPNAPATCSQVITVTHHSDWVVEFPADITAQCVDGTLPEFGEPQIFFDECELIGVSYEDEYFYVVVDACYKIIRHWTVINWCIYEDFGSDVWEENGHAECNLFVDWDGDGDFDCRTFRDGWNASGNPGTADGYIDYDQTIKVVDEEAPIFNVDDQEVCIEETDCDTDVTLPTPDVTDCSTGIEITVTSDLPNPTGDQYVYANVPPGTYTATYEVTDNCGNTSYDEITITVVDCKKPTPYCVNGLTIEIMQTGMVDIWAVDLDAGSFDNCPGDLQFSLSSDVNDTQQIFTCDDLGPFVVQLWVTDEAGNQDFCETLVILQDNMNHCDVVNMPVTIAGGIATEEEEPVEGVAVLLNNGQLTTATDNFGDYTLFPVLLGQDYTVAPFLDEDADNGVSTYDLVLISRHILGVELLNSPYKLIAADANNSGQVTTLDMVDIRKVILQIASGFPNNTSWRFVDKDFVFPNPQSPFANGGFPEVISYNNLLADDLQADFVAVKVGDVNSTAQTATGVDAEDRSFGGVLPIRVQDREITAGQTVTVEFTAADLNLLGYQFTLEFAADKLYLVEVLPGLATIDNFGLSFLEEGVLTTSWHSPEAVPMGDGQALFSLSFQAQASGNLRDLLAVSSRYTQAEAYDGSEEVLDLQLTFDGQTLVDNFQLYQNRPNPFREQTAIGFQLSQPEEITLSVTDAAGKVVWRYQGAYGKGYHEVQLDQLPAKGVYYYRLETATHTATRKMIYLD